MPPFNRLSWRLVGSVAPAGLAYVSVDGDFPGLAMPTVNVHADVLDWRARSAAEPQALVRRLVAALRLRRHGLLPRRRPVGVLTHHLGHDDRAWALAEELLERLAAHRTVQFPPLSTLFPA